MQRDKLIEIARSAWLSDYGVQTMLNGGEVEMDLETLEAIVKLVAAHTLANIDPSSFMSYQEGFEAGNRLAVDGICRQLRQLHDSYSLASNPSQLKVKNDY